MLLFSSHFHKGDFTCSKIYLRNPISKHFFVSSLAGVRTANHVAELTITGSPPLLHSAYSSAVVLCCKYLSVPKRDSPTSLLTSIFFIFRTYLTNVLNILDFGQAKSKIENIITLWSNAEVNSINENNYRSKTLVGLSH